MASVSRLSRGASADYFTYNRQADLPRHVLFYRRGLSLYARCEKVYGAPVRARRYLAFCLCARFKRLRGLAFVYPVLLRERAQSDGRHMVARVGTCYAASSKG